MKVFLYYFLKTRDITIIQIKYYRCQTKGIVQNIPASHFDPIFIFFLLWNTKCAIKQNIQGRFHISKVDGHKKKVCNKDLGSTYQHSLSFWGNKKLISSLIQPCFSFCVSKKKKKIIQGWNFYFWVNDY